MQDFVVGDDSRASRSIGFDATKRRGLIVTVGVLVNRTQEAMLLDDLYHELADDGYLPFRTKSRDLSVSPNKIRHVIRRCTGKIGICIHQDDVTLSYAEATHSAILLSELNVTTDDTVAIVDGDRSRANLLYHAASGIETIPPAIVNCTQSELYYPHLLLADLIAGFVADQVESNPTIINRISLDGSLVAVMDTTANSRNGRWERGYSATARREGDVQWPDFEQRYADSLRERVSCWFHGLFGDRDSHPPTSDGITPVVGRLEALECDNIATWLDEQ